MLKFSPPDNNVKELLLPLCRDTISGTEAYTFLKLYENIPEGSFWCGKNENGEIESLIFNNGDEDIKVFGSEFSELFLFSEKCLMIYENKTLPQSEAVEIEGNKLLDFYKLISESDKLSFDNERRYVLRLRSVNKGLSKIFAVFLGEKLVSCAAISAVNEKYALIADVFTHPEYRKKGYAAKCVKTCVNYALSQGKIPYLRCEEKMCDYYKKLGFSYYGKM
ncbi:MAG: GNAT family N-acetyltransferase [Clostridia bacterium]|nr:GNAT family N-acetyltransferase [Clostridia bacterium]